MATVNSPFKDQFQEVTDSLKRIKAMMRQFFQLVTGQEWEKVKSIGVSECSATRASYDVVDEDAMEAIDLKLTSLQENSSEEEIELRELQVFCEDQPTVVTVRKTKEELENEIAHITGKDAFEESLDIITWAQRGILGEHVGALQEMRVRKEERLGKFQVVKTQIHKISTEIAGQPDDVLTPIFDNENDLSPKKLEEYQTELQYLYTEKNERLRQVEKYKDIIHSLLSILGKDFSAIITEVHPSLNADLCGTTKNISDSILAKLNHIVEYLVEEKHKPLAIFTI